MAEYFQNYNPTGNVWLSTFLAALPIIVLLYLLALHPHKDKQGNKQLGIFAPYAAITAAIVAILVAIFMMKMPVPTTLAAFGYGALSGLFPIGWIIFAAIFLYNTTLITGKFEILKNSVASLSPDRRLQALLIAFSFGAFIEGASGFGTPVAVSGAIMVGLGFRPMTAAVICLIANTAPVAWGAIGTPILTLGQVTGIPAELISMQAGRQLPFFSVIVPFWLVATLVFMDKGSWKDVWEVWPATLVSGLSFAITQFAMSQAGNVMLVDIGSGIVSMVVTALFLKVWSPKNIMGHEDAHENKGAATQLNKKKLEVPKHSMKELITAWMPWAFLAIAVFFWGMGDVKTFLNGIFNPKFPVPFLDGMVHHTAPVGSPDTPMAAVYSWNILTMAGTGIMLAAILSNIFVLRLSAAQWAQAFNMTAKRMVVPITVICSVLGLGYLTRYAGTDAILGLAFTKTGSAYPFFASMLGWLGVFLTGSDTSSNAMFGGLQKITAEQLGLNPVLIVTANSTGGVMGKMIDAQSIVVATVACYENHQEGMAAVGPIFRAVIWHSIALAVLLSGLVWAQAYIFPWMQVTM
ncbi:MULTISPECIES: L-lactate permease [Desulfitobacterium]|uniref:L-lactate permease n=1 Tax=Desulfitobacterium dehalogenans (strain ATCC 51507 / DSM 9161 / JW/IU-DC1) TaxID=756499 RepID=I4AB05_DESDJ|nr:MULTISPECIES: L-lactate permease [Desulfitobacterium]AFM01140.1 L-lactate transport [Desulfitobacterium dehalogenans ATCC 51507]